jgi:hypothetical protein
VAVSLKAPLAADYEVAAATRPLSVNCRFCPRDLLAVRPSSITWTRFHVSRLTSGVYVPRYVVPSKSKLPVLIRFRSAWWT